MIDLLEIFKDMPDYAIMKIRGNFPEHDHGQDIDIACRSAPDVYVYLYKCFEHKKPIVVAFPGDDKHIHFDLIDGGGIELRFDLYQEFIKPGIVEAVLDHKMIVKYGDNTIWIAGYHEDILIKSWEYHTNGKEQYRDYAKYIDGLDAHKNE